MDQQQGDQGLDHGYAGPDQSGKWPPGSRLFLGNLASEKTSREELHAIFSKYGPIVGNIALRRSFGFIQFESAEHAQAAMAAENGRIIGGIRLDIKLANSSEQKGGKGKRRREETGWDQGGGPQGHGQQGPPKQRRGGPPRGPRGPPRGDNWGRQGGGGGGGWDNQGYGGQHNDRGGRGNWGNDGGNYDNWGGEGGYDNNYGNDNNQGWNQAPLCEVVYLGFDQGRYAGGIAQMLRDRLDISVDSYFIEKMTITDLFHDARTRGVRYVLLVGDQNEQQGTVNVNKLFRHGRPEAHRNVAQQDAMDMIAQGEGIPLRPPPLRSPPRQAYPPQQQHGGPPQPAGVQPLMEAMGALLGNLQQQQPGGGQPGAPNPLLLLTQALAQASNSGGAPPNLNSLQGLLSSLQAQQNTLNTTQPPQQQPPQVQQAYQPQTQPQQPQVQQAYQPQAQPQYQQQVPQQPQYQQQVPQQQQVKPQPQYQQVPQQYAQQPTVVQQAQPQPQQYQQQPPKVVQQPPGVYAQPLPPQYTQQPQQQLQQPLQMPPVQPPVPGVVSASLQDAVEKFTAENL